MKSSFAHRETETEAKEDSMSARNQFVISKPLVRAAVLRIHERQIRSITFEIQINLYRLVNNSNINLY
jgi:hypothetical protein